MMNVRKAVVWAVASIMAVAVADAAESKAFKTTFNAGVTATDGNSETMQANAALVTEGEKEGLGSVRAGVEGGYGESTVDDETSTTIENARGFVNVKKTLSPRTFAYVDGSVLYDDIAEVDYRATVGPGLGAYLFKNERTSLSVELGVAYVWEKVGGERDDYLAVRIAERFDHALSDTARVWQSAEYLPQADDFENYLINAELGVEAALNSRMNLRLVLQDKYNNQPAEGLERNDLTLMAGVGIRL